MSSIEKYARAAAKTIVAQLLIAQGIEEAQSSTIEILSDLLTRYIVELGNQSHMVAELSHRIDSTPLDVGNALKAMGHSIRDLQGFLTTIEGVPFGQNITPFPSQKQLTRLPTFAVSQETPPPHIPRFLPVFPDPHARFESPEYAKGPDSSHARQQQLVQQQQEGEEALLRIEARQAPPDGALQQAARGFQEPEETKGQAEAEVNPFFAPILWEAPAARGVEGGSNVKNVEAPSKKPLDWMEAETLNPPTMQYHGWQWTNSLAEQASLARSGRVQVQDAYAEEAGEGEAAGTILRRRVISTNEASRARAREILSSSRVEDVDHGYGALEDIGEEHI